MEGNDTLSEDVIPMDVSNSLLTLSADTNHQELDILHTNANIPKNLDTSHTTVWDSSDGDSVTSLSDVTSEDEVHDDIAPETIDEDVQSLSSEDDAPLMTSTPRSNRRRQRSRGISRSIRSRRPGIRRRGSRVSGRGRSVLNRDSIPTSAVDIHQDEAGREDDEEFCPLRNPGPYLPLPQEGNISELHLFRLFFDDDILARLVDATNKYAEEKKLQKKVMYTRFKRRALTKEEMMRFLGVFIILSINNIRNYKQVWRSKSSQVHNIIRK